MCVPLVLFFSHGGWPTAIAAFVMVCFHLVILTAIPMGVPLEWNVFMIFGVLWLFVAHADVGLADLHNPVPVAILFVVVAGIVILGNLFPRKISFLPGMRYYAGNWDTTLWCIKPSAEEKIDNGLVAIASMPQTQLERFYGNQEAAQILLYLGYAFRRLQHSRPRADHPCAPGDGGPERGRLHAHRRGTDLQYWRSAGISATATCTTSN